MEAVANCVVYDTRIPNASIVIDVVGVTNRICINNECVYVLAFETDRKDLDFNKYRTCTIYETRKGYHVICDKYFRSLEDFVYEVKKHTESVEWINKQYELNLYVHRNRGFTLRCSRKYFDGCDIKPVQIAIKNKYQLIMISAYEVCRRDFCDLREGKEVY